MIWLDQGSVENVRLCFSAYVSQTSSIIFKAVLDGASSISSSAYPAAPYQTPATWQPAPSFFSSNTSTSRYTTNSIGLNTEPCLVPFVILKVAALGSLLALHRQILEPRSLLVVGFSPVVCGTTCQLSFNRSASPLFAASNSFTALIWSDSFFTFLIA